jgi:hypothetical protein
MKKLYAISLFFFLSIPCLLFAANVSKSDKAANNYVVSTDIQKKNVLLEEFTGLNCGHCPEGHAIANSLSKAQDCVYVMAVHAGYFAVPGSDQSDYRTVAGDTLNNAFGVDSYPSGTVNRHDFSGSGIITGRSEWIKDAKSIHADDAPVNLFVSGVYDGMEHTMTVHVEGYFTAEQQAANQELEVAWTQDNIEGYQNGSGMGNNYLHRHMLRAYVTPVWGDTLKNAVKGEYFSRDYKVDVPRYINEVKVVPENIQIIAFVTNGKTDVLNVTGSKPAYNNYSKNLGGTLSEPKQPIGTYYDYQFFDVTLTNNSDTPMKTATFDITVNGVTSTAQWNGEIGSYASREIRLGADYKMVDGNNYNKFAIALKTINGESVTQSTYSGEFLSALNCTPTINIKITTDGYPDENTFCIKDENGNVVKEFGPYAASSTNSETVTLEANKYYCFEISDAWGDGLQDPQKGYFVSHSDDGTMIEQVYSITNLGYRSFMYTSKQPSGIQETADEPMTVDGIYTVDGRYAGASTSQLYPGLYIQSSHNSYGNKSYKKIMVK